MQRQRKAYGANPARSTYMLHSTTLLSPTIARALSILILAFCASCSKAPGLVDAGRVDRALSQLVEDGKVVGVSALVYEDGDEVYFGAFGHADREKGHPMQRDTIVQIFSMTKPTTGVALMTLYEEGKFDLDDPLAMHAPEFSDMLVFGGEAEDGSIILETPKRAPTVYDVMRHTAGFAGGADETPIGRLYAAEDPMNREHSLAEMASRLSKVPLAYHPGERWIYGPSVDVQAYLVERLSGMPFDEYVRKTIFQPLGMTETAYFVAEDKRDRFARLYQRSEDGSLTPFGPEVYEDYLQEWPLKRGGSGLTSTLDDYMRFARMLLNGGELDGTRILRADTVALMTANALPEDITDTSWLPTKGQVGFGIDFAIRIAPPTDAEEASGAVGEFFWDGAANTLFWVDPKNKITAVLFAQWRPYGGVPLHKSFRDAIYTEDPEAFAN